MLSSEGVCDAMIRGIEAHIGHAKVYDDIALLVIKQK